MADLIDRTALKRHYAWWGDTDERRLFDDIVDAQPTVDAVPVVRCKDCKYRNLPVCPMGNVSHDVDFCSSGKLIESPTDGKEPITPPTAEWRINHED